MSKQLFSSRGTSIQIGRELGKGGEGSVYEVPSLPNQVAKLYHKNELPDQKKQAKLSFMAATANQQPLKYVAWPQETLHPHPGGPVIGFLMAKVTGREPIHAVYSPAHRRQERPKAAWDFLIFVARNTAAAFDALHSHGHVLGDVNQGNIMVGADSKVVLIDSDSFQVNTKNSLHQCEVGVGHFTPPELQGLSSFKGFTRTTNHDNFGLALLIFHLLLGGRHPYAGVPLMDGVGNSLESDIKGFRYAYAQDAQARGFAPPPRSIPLNTVPDNFQSMFHLAFTENGASVGRPTAKQWVSALDYLRSKLKRCSASAMHLYPEHLSKCPWCNLEHQGVVYFIDLGDNFTSSGSGFVLARVWAAIEAVSPPPTLAIPNIHAISVKPRSLPSEIPGAALIGFYKALVLGLAILIFSEVPKAWILILLAGWIGWNIADSAGSGPRAQERARRKQILDTAEQEFNNIMECLKKEAGPDGFMAKRIELRKLYEEHKALPQMEKQELDKLHSTARERQKYKFLDGYFIDHANISGVGPARKTILHSYGIETAADVDRHRIKQIRGFGDSLTRAIMDWKASVERKFVFNPNNAVSESDKNVVRAKIATRKATLETFLNAGVADLMRFKQQAAARLTALRPKLEQSAKNLAQAKSDLSLL